MITLTDNLTSSDVDEINRLHAEYWGPNGHSISPRDGCVFDSVAKDGDKVLGYGQATHFVELQLFLDPNLRKREKAIALRKYMRASFYHADRVHAQAFYAFVRDNPDYSLLLQKHYDFKPVSNPGEMLIRRLL